MKAGDKIDTGGEDWEVISTYSRAQAIEDGILADVNALAPDLIANAGIKLHVAMTSTVWDEFVVVPEDVVGQDWKGRLWDILWLMRTAAKRATGDTIYFTVNVQNDNAAPRPVRLKAVCGPDDDGEPCLTLMAPEED